VTTLDDGSNSIIILGENDFRSKLFQDMHLNTLCCFYLEFKNRSSLCNMDFRFFSGKNIGNDINSLPAGILIVKNNIKEQLPFEYEIKPKIDFVIKMKFRKFLDSLTNLLN
jgi:hypothetical protein